MAEIRRDRTNDSDARYESFLRKLGLGVHHRRSSLLPLEQTRNPPSHGTAVACRRKADLESLVGVSECLAE